MAEALSKTYRPATPATLYSGVVVEIDSGGEEVSPTSSSLNLITLPLEIGEKWWYQTFRFPEDYKRVDRIPDLSGFQLLTTIETGRAATAELNFVIEQYLLGSGWTALAKGTVKGSHADGTRVWMDLYLEKEIPINETQIPDARQPKAPTEFRLGFQNVQYVNEVWYTEPNPYAHGEAIIEPGTGVSEFEKKLEKREANVSFNFRMLSMTADSGVDFLGNPYRSAVAKSSSQEPSGDNTNSGYWLSGPQPSRFAVVSHYSDVRPVSLLPKYGNINLLPNPSFEYDLLEKEPALWKETESYWTLSGATVVMHRWRGLWLKTEEYAKGESVVAKDGKHYISLINNNRNHDPTEGAPWWEVSSSSFEPPQGQRYLEVKTH